ncbi:TorD/DmsD family molecular chaperone [Corynebacterium cystitidis]|uniref:TorD/DmsD family molecular chaperone n=1 Tax=Corynebacterium cystitidis TaxID=35757 RepID=UPI00211ED966|nr:molecular chaperone TorD family protein [Corynebacterium cystitidis]
METDRAQRLAIAADIVGQLFLEAPRPALAAALHDEEFLQDWPLDDDHSRAATRMLRSASPDSADELKRDHLYLFTGIGAPLAQPYESPYFSPDGLVFDSATAEVAEIYRQVGFSTGTDTMPADHIGFQLLCVGHITRQIAALAPSVGAYTEILRSFVDKHLGRFSEHVLVSVEEHARCSIYQALPGLTRGVITTALTLC